MAIILPPKKTEEETKETVKKKSSIILPPRNGEGFSIDEEKEEKPTLFKTVGEIAKEVVRAPFRGLATPFATSYQDITQLVTGERPESVKVPLLGEIGISSDPKKAIGQLGERILDVGTLVLGGSAAKAAVKEIAKQGIKTTVKKLITKKGVKQIAKIAAVDAGVGFGYGATIKMQDAEAKASDVLKSGIIGAGFGIALPRILGAGLKVGIGTTKTLSKELGEIIEKSAIKLEEKAMRPRREFEEAAKKLDLVFEVDIPFKTQTTGEYLSEKGASVLRAMQKLPSQAKTYLYDKLTPITEFAFKLSQIRGAKVDLTESFQRLYPKAAARAELMSLDYVKDGIKKFGFDTWQRAKVYARYLDALDRLNLGQKVTGGHSKERLLADVEKFKNTLKPEEFTAIQNALTVQQGYLRAILKEMRDVGRISQESYDKLLATHPNYIPHEVIFARGNIDDALLPSKTFTGRSLELKGAKGSKKEIEDADIAIMNYFYEQTLRNEKQKAVNELFDAVKGFENEMGFEKIKKGIKIRDIPKDKDKISRIKNGVLEEWIIPSELAAVLKGSSPLAGLRDALINNPFAKLLTVPASLTRAIATSFSPVFAIFSNPMRDLQTVQITADLGAKEYGRGLLASLFKGKASPELQKIYREAQEAGVFLGSVFREEADPQKRFTRILEDAGFLTKTIPRTFREMAEFIPNLGQAFEEATRLGVYQTAIKKGSTPKEAAKLAANASVDFSKSGSLIQVVNMVIPFLNARIQGVANLGKAIGENPQKFLRRSMYTAAYPTMILNSWNTNHDSYFSIPENERRKYWIVMVGENRGKDYAGRPTKIPHYVKIPKGEAQQAMASVIDRVLNFGKEKYPLETKDFLLRVAGDLSPVQGAGFIPPGWSQAIELEANYSFFRGREIEPEWVKHGNSWYKTGELDPEFRFNPQTTSEVSKILGEIFNWSPSKIDYVLKTGVLNDVIRMIDLGIKPQKDQGESLFEKLTELPLSRSIFGKTAVTENLQEKKEEEEKIREKNRRKIERLLK